MQENGAKKDPKWLLAFKSRVFSQNGEDGVIEKILNTLPNKDGWCVEFGAWDGLFLSNVRNLIEHKEYSAVLIEGNTAKAGQLKKNYAHNPKVIARQGIVGFSKQDGLDCILKHTPTPANFDFLSIDIDGNDYHVWNAVQFYKPKVVCIEYNETIPTEVLFVQNPDPALNQGSSLLSIVILGKEKGYELVSVIAHNAIFVKVDYYPLFDIKDNSPFALRENNKSVTYIFSGFDGQVFLTGRKHLPWHRLEIKESRIQPLPKLLRTYPPDYTRIQKMAFNLFLLFRYPKMFLHKVREN